MGALAYHVKGPGFNPKSSHSHTHKESLGLLALPEVKDLPPQWYGGSLRTISLVRGVLIRSLFLEAPRHQAPPGKRCASFV